MTEPVKRKLYWCNSHQREATHFDFYYNQFECDPTLGGILLPCNVVHLTDKVEITEE